MLFRSRIPVVGPGLDIRPSQVDYAVRQLGGGPANQILGASDIVRQGIRTATGQPPMDERSNIQDIPVIGGLISPLIGSSTGGTFTREAGRIMASRAGQVLVDSGVQWRPPAVDDHIGKVPLTRTERGEVQAETNRLWNEYVANVKQWVPNWDQTVRDERETILKNLYNSAHRASEQNLMDRYPDRWKPVSEQVRRVTIEQQRKAS